MQKVVAASGAKAVPVLLAWSSATVQQRLAELLKGANADQLAAMPFMEALICKASSAMQGSMQATGKNDVELVTAFLQQPGALSWEEMLAMPYLEQLLQAAVAEDATLLQVLEQLGLAHLTSASELPPAASALEHMVAESKQRLASAASTSIAVSDLAVRAGKAAAAASDDEKAAMLADAVNFRVSSFCRSQLGLDAAGHVHTITRVLGYERPISADKKAAASSAVAVALDLDMDVVKAAALQLLESPMPQKAGVGLVLKSSDADMAASLNKLASNAPDSAAAKLMSALSHLRAKLVQAGDVHTLVSTTASDVAALSVEEFWAVHKAARRSEAAGSTLAKALLAPSADTAPLGLEAVSKLPDQDRAALAWVLCRSSGAPGVSQAHPTGPAAATALMAAFNRRAVGAAQAAATAAAAAQDLEAALKLEADLAEAALMGAHRAPLEPRADGGDVGVAASMPSAPALTAAQRGASKVDPALLLLDALVAGVSATDSWAAAQQVWPVCWRVGVGVVGIGVVGD